MKKKISCINTEFCKRLEGDLGFQYTEAFCRSVEVYSDSLETLKPGIFEYRGSYLRYAFERYLYFTFVNNARLYSFFNEWKNGKLPSFSRAIAGIERNLSLCICGEKITQKDIIVKFKHSVDLNALLHCGRLLAWEWSYSYSGKLFTTSRPQNNNSADVLIYIPSEKFVRYFSPITRILPFSFSYFIDNSNSWIADFIISQGLPFIDSRKLNISLWSKQRKYLPEGSIIPEHLVFWHDCLFESIKVLRPRCVIVAEGNAPGDELMNQVCKQLSIPIICLQHGWAPIVHNGFRNMSYTKMFIWGKSFGELLHPYNPRQTFVVTGNHILETEKNSVSMGDIVSRQAVCFFLQMPSRLINEECWNEFFKLMLWTAGKFRHIPVIAREHPISPLPKRLREEVKRYPNIIIRSTSQYSLMEALRESQLTLSICSSTILESIASGVLPVIFNMTSMPTIFREIEEARAGLEVKSPQEAQDAISRCLTDKDYRKQFDKGIKLFQENYFYRNEVRAVDRIVEEITSIINN